MIKTINAKAIHERQLSFAQKVDEQGLDYGLTIADAFVESVRDLGYKSTGTAMNENIDNAAEAGAENVHVVFGYDEGSRMPKRTAIIDDGIGIVKPMIRPAMLWGGTDRHGSRDLFGRYGYGLPSSAVSQGRRFSVLSRTDGGIFYGATTDLDDITSGALILKGRIEFPETVEAELPDFVAEYAEKSFPGGAAAIRTVILWEKLDRLRFSQAAKLENHLLETFGITYRNQLRSMSIAVNGKPVEPVDPLFITPAARHYDLDEDRADPVEPIVFEAKDPDTRESLGVVKVRMSVLPPTFARIDKSRKATKGNQNARFKIVDSHNGLIVLRAGRQIDVVNKGLPTTFGNNDRFAKIELDFPPTLDEWFGVTTSKQQITLSHRVIELLTEHRVWKTLEKARGRYGEMEDDLETRWDDAPDARRPSEIAMEEAAPLNPASPPSERRSSEAEEGHEKEVDDLVGRGVPRDEAEKLVEAMENQRPFRVEMERNPEGPFYRSDLKGGQIVLLINTAHRFFGDVYAAVKGPEGARIRQALEVLLFVMAECEADASEAGALWYKSERAEWSKRLTTALTKLDAIIESRPDADSEFDHDLATADA